MTRLENVKQAGFFALPEELPPIIASYIQPAEQRGRIIDPCAGEGVALVEFSKLLNLDPYGIEINEGRAQAAKQLVNSYLANRDFGSNGRRPTTEQKRILQGGYASLKSTSGAYVVNYNNPPYMFADDKADGRVEYQFLRDTRHLLQPGGLLIWVVPQHMLMHKLAPQYLHTWFDDLLIRRFPDELYSDFKQVVVFGVKREFSIAPEAEAINEIKDLGRLGSQVEELTLQDVPSYILPEPAAVHSFRFRSWYVDPKDAIREAQTRGVVTTREFQDLFSDQTQSIFSPLTPMKIGHLVGIIAAGHLNNQVLEQGDERILIKGHSFKIREVKKEREEREEGYAIYTKSTDKVITNITYLTPAGRCVTLKPEELNNFMAKWIEQLTQVVSDTYKPRYKFDLNGYGRTLNRLNLKRTLPFYGKPGLLPAQKHAAAAMATQLTDHESALLVGTMGTGKTVMATAVAAVLHNHVRKTSHTIVLCPPHLVKKWIREIKVTWPKAKAMALKTISDVDTFFATEGPIFGVMKETSARSGSGWSHAYHYLGATAATPRGPKAKVTFSKRSQLSKEQGKKPVEDDPFFYPRLKYMHRIQPLSCPTCGHGVNLTASDGGDVPAVPASFKNKQLYCSVCNQPLFQDDRRRSKGMILHGFEKYAQREKRFLQNGRLTASNGNNGYAKYPLASYIFRKYNGRVHLLIADEVHQYKAADSDRGYAFHRLVSASQRTLALTGTIYGGKASSIFDLLYRLSPEVRKAFTNKGAKGKRRLMRTTWVDKYGILQEVSSTRYDENGKQSGNSKERTILKELPGASPSMLPWILNMAIFVNLENMGVALPPYEEIPIAVSMTEEMQMKYNTFRNVLTEILRKRLLNDDKSLLGAYLQSLLTWPDSPWRNKQVADPYNPDNILARIKACDMPLGAAPKEREIIELIKDEKAAGRKTLLLCQQTSTLDITPQWEEMLSREGIKVAVLRSTPPDKREAWIKKQVEDSVDVVITHPKKVETGLDLLDFPTEIWMGIEYSIYTVLQASRRAWRLGQDKNVKVYFFVYENTLQAQAIRLIAAKVGAALRVNGDTIPDDSLAELDDLAQTDMVNALTEMLLQEADYEAEMKELNAAYEAAKNGNLNFSEKYNFADTMGDKKAIRKKWAAWAKELHPDKHQQDEPAERRDDLQAAFQNAANFHNEEESFIGDFSMDVDEEPAEAFEPEPEPEEFVVTEYPAAEPVRVKPYGHAAIRKAKRFEQAPFIVNIPTEEKLKEALRLACAMVAVLNQFTDPTEARDELMTYRFGKRDVFKNAVTMRMYANGYDDDEIEPMIRSFWATAMEMTDWILAKEEALLENDGETFQSYRGDEMCVLAEALWHEAQVDVELEPIPEPELRLEPTPKPKVKRLEFGVTNAKQFIKPTKKKAVSQAQMSLF